MAGFEFSEEQEMFRHAVRDFVRKEFIPGSKERAKQNSLPPELLKRTGELGFLAPQFPSKHGGQDGDVTSLGIAIEEIAKGDFNFPLAMVDIHGAGLALKSSTEDMREEWLPPLARGEQVVCLGLTEPDAGSDAASIKMRAAREGDFYILNGEKTSVSLGMQANVAYIFAKTEPAAKARGVTCFWVPLNLPGIERSRFPDMGWMPLGRASIIMDGVRIPVRYRIGEEGEGFYKVMRTFDDFRVLLALMGLGAAQSSLEDAISYAKQRTAFGKPIAKFEGVSFKIAEAATEIEAARLLCYRTLWMSDHSMPCAKEAAMSKLFGVRVAVRVAYDALRIHGHIGYSAEYPLEQRLRDIMGLEVGADGTPEIMKIVISREVIGREFLPY
jgi:cyclohexanecarboxyl-CoA dehydrogenase